MEGEAHRNGSPGQLSNGTGAAPQGSREATVPVAAQRENGVQSAPASVATAVVSATPVLPSMPQGVTLSNIIMDEVTGVCMIKWCFSGVGNFYMCVHACVRACARVRACVHF